MNNKDPNVLLEVKNLSKSFKRKKVVTNISFSIKRGQVIGILGPNGAGKTTTFYMIVGLEKPDHGAIYLNQEEISHLPMYQRALRGISYLPQEASIFRKLNVEDNILAVLELNRKLNLSERKKRLEELLKFLHIGRIRHEYGYSLSGGERRRVEIARALATDPHVLLLDEPFAGIDPRTIGEIQEIIRDLSSNWNVSFIITDHNVRETLKISDYTYIVAEGKIFQEGTPEELIHSEKLRHLYLGDQFNL